MPTRILKLASALFLLAAVWAWAPWADTAFAGAPHLQAAQAVEEGNPNLLTIVFATLGASFGAAALASLGYLLRRRLGLEWHRSQGGAGAAGHHQEEEEAAGKHQSGPSRPDPEGGGGHP